MPLKIVTWNVNGIRSWTYPLEIEKGKPPVGSLKELLDFFDADIICFQETKLRPGSLTAAEALVEGYFGFFSICPNARGYSGTATYCRATALPLRAEEGFTGLLPLPAVPTKEFKEGGKPSAERIGAFSELYAAFDKDELRELDKEGRCVMTDHGDFVLLNVYFPNAGDTEKRHSFKMRFYQAVEVRVKSLIAAGRHVVIVGDVNCSAQEIDHCEPSKMVYTDDNGVTITFHEMPSRKWFAQFLARRDPPSAPSAGAALSASASGATASAAGAVGAMENKSIGIVSSSSSSSSASPSCSYSGGPFVDLFRHYQPDERNAFTCWNTKIGARAGNYGTRIDYVLVNRDLVAKNVFTSCKHLVNVFGSDHCPVVATLAVDRLGPPSVGRLPPVLCAEFLPSFLAKQQKLSAFFGAGAGASSGSRAAATPSPVPAQQQGMAIASSGGGAVSPPSAAASRAAAAASPLSADAIDAAFFGVDDGARPSSEPPGFVAESLAAAGASASKASAAASSGPGAGSKRKQPAPAKSASLLSYFQQRGGEAAKKPRLEQALSSASSAAAATTASAFAPVVGAGSSSAASSASTAASAAAREADDLALAMALSAEESKMPAAAAGPLPAETQKTKQQWNQLLNQREVVVRCKVHNLPCKLWTVNKQGVNKGRQFYMCNVPLPGRCNFFVWHSQLASTKNGQLRGNNGPGQVRVVGGSKP